MSRNLELEGESSPILGVCLDPWQFREKWARCGHRRLTKYYYTFEDDANTTNSSNFLSPRNCESAASVSVEAVENHGQSALSMVT